MADLMTAGRLGAIEWSYLNRIGHGMRLRIDHATGQGQIVEGLAQYGQTRSAIPVPPAVVMDLLDCGLLCKLTELGEGQRGGWLEAGYDGAIADWYVFVQ